MKDNPEKLLLQLQNDFEVLMSRAAKEKKSSHLLSIEAMSLKKQDEKLREIKKLDEGLEDLGKRRKKLEKGNRLGILLRLFLVFR